MPSILYRVKPQTGLHITVLCMAFNKLLTLLKVPDNTYRVAAVSLWYYDGIWNFDK